MKFETPAGGISSNHFVKLKDKEKIVGLFRGDPFTFRDHWTGQRSEVCPGSTDCPRCAKNEKSKFRFHINFLTQDNHVWTPKIFAGGWTVFQSLKALHEGDYDLEKTKVSINRSGTGTDTSYNILPSRDWQLSEGEDMALKSVTLLSLNPKEFETVQVVEVDEIPF